MSFFWATWALSLSILVATSSTSCFSATSMQPTAARIASAGIATFRVFMRVPPALGRMRPGDSCAGQGLYRSDAGKRIMIDRRSAPSPPTSGSGLPSPVPRLVQDPDLSVPLDHLADDRRLLSRPAERLQDRPCLRGGDDEDHPDTHIEDAVHLVAGDVPGGFQEAEDRRELPGAFLDLHRQTLGDHAGDVLGHAAAGDVGHRPDGVLLEDLPDRAGVDPRGRQQRPPQRGPLEARVEVLVFDDLAGERISVRVQSARGKRDHRVPGLHALSVDDLRLLHDADAESGEVIVPVLVHPWYIGGLSTEKGAGRL